MVRILSSGEIIPDEDPRAHQIDSNIQARTTIPRRDRGRGKDNVPIAAAGQTRVEGDYEVTRRGGPINPGVFHGDTSPVSIYDAANARLQGFGLPPLTVAGIIIQPVISVCAVLACLLLGLPGVFLVAILFAVNYATQNEAQIASWIGIGNNNANPPAQAQSSTPAARTTTKNEKIDKNAPFMGAGRKLGK